MVQLYSLMWILAVFFAIIGVMRGWTKEIIATAGIMLALFALFQFDSLLRGTVLLTFPTDQVFFIQAAVFLLVVFIAYTNRTFISDDTPDRVTLQEGLLGGIIGFVNGYLVGGSLWYFMDINEYPFSPYITAPAADSISAQNLNAMPLVILGGGATGSGDLLAVAVIGIFLLVLIVL